MIAHDRATAPASAGSFRGVARGGFANLAGAIASAAANLLLVVVVARGLPTPEAGVVFATTSLFLLAETGARLGTDTSIVHFIAQASARGRPNDITEYLRLALKPVLVVASAAGAALALAAPAVLTLIVGDTEVPHARALIAVLAAAVPIAAGYDVVIAATRGLDTMKPTVVLERLARPALQAVLVLGAVLAGGGAFAVVCAFIVPYPFVAALAVVALRHRIPKPVVDRSVPATADRVDGGRFWRFTLPRAFAGVLQIALQRLDILLVGAIRGAAAAAIYTAATRFVVAGQLGNQAVWYAVQPRLAGLVANDELEAARRLYRISTAWIIALTWPLFLVAAVAAPLILRILGRGYHSGGTVMVLLALAMLLSSACGLVDVVLITVGKTTWNLLDTLLAFVVNVGVDLLLIPRFGITGAAIGWALAIVVRNVAALVQVSSRFGFRPLSRLSVDVAASAAVAFAAVPGAALIAFGDDSRAVAVAVAAGAAGYALQLWWMRRRLHLDFVVGRRLE